ncbi:MAG: hypothetical protein ACAI38_08200 [Myxococcota bacterium]|nr:hypothetical protein [Myxococcota bacterium]
MLHVLVAVSLLADPAAVEVVGSASPLKWTPKVTGYEVPKGGVAYKVTGPTPVLLELRGKPSERGKPVTVELVRDEESISRNQVSLKPKPAGGPKTHPLYGKLSWKVPEGTHTYRITAGSGAVTATLKAVDKVAGDAVAAVEQPYISTDSTVVADATPAPPPSTASSTPAKPIDLGASSTAAAAIVADQLGGGTATGSVAKATRIAVYDFELAGVEPNVGAVVTDSVLAEMRKLQRVSAIGMDEIRDMLSHEANKQFMGCEENEACLAEIAGALGVDELVSGSLAKVEGSHVLVIRRIDQNRAKVVGTVDKRLKAESGQEFLAAVGPAVEELFPEYPVREGLSRGVPRDVALRLDPPPLPKWVFWGTAGAAAATAVAGGLFAYLAHDSEKQWNDTVNAGGSTGVPGDTLVDIGNTAESRAKTANVFFISSGVLAVSAGVIALFTDWHGYRDQPSAQTAAAR